MSCNACSKQYGFFCKEVGCPSCGFSFCTKCLKKIISVPKLGGSEQKVCLSCWDKITKGLDINASTKSKKPISPSPLDDPIPDDIQSNLDIVLEKRLAALKENDDTNLNQSTTDEMIAIRVANLKDIPYNKTNNKDLLTMIDKRTEEEKTADLIKQFLDENQIDSNNATSSTSSVGDSVSDIEKRLAALRGERDIDNKLSIQQDNSWTNVGSVVKRYMDEAKLPEVDQLTEEEQEFVQNAEGKSAKDLEELPWCSICNEDARLRCLGCEGDLFCRDCFKEFHADDEEYREHSTKSYVNKKDSSN